MEKPELHPPPIHDKHQPTNRPIPNDSLLANPQGVGNQCEENTCGILVEDECFTVSQRSNHGSESASIAMEDKEDGKANSPFAAGTGLPVTDPRAFDAEKARKQALFQQFPSELFFESFTYLDRSSLDGMPLVHGRLGTIVEQRMQHLCLRQIGRASLAVVTGIDAITTDDNKDHSKMLVPVPEILPRFLPTFSFCRVSCCTLHGGTPSVDEHYFACEDDAAAFFCSMVRSSRIDVLEILFDHEDLRLCLYPEFLHMLSQVAPTVCVDRLQFARCSFAAVDHSLFRSLLRRFSELQAVKISDSAMDGVPISDETLRECAELGITDLHIDDSFPEVRNTPITDQAIVDFLFQKTDQKVQLTVQDPSITREFAAEIFKAVRTSQSENQISATFPVNGGHASQFFEQVSVLCKDHFGGSLGIAPNGAFVTVDFPPTTTTWSRMSFVNDWMFEDARRLIFFERNRLPAADDQDQ